MDGERTADGEWAANGERTANRKRNGKRSAAVTALVAFALGGGTALAVGATSTHDAATAKQPEPTPDTVAITRTDLVEKVKVTGALDYGPTRQIVGHGGAGTVTELPAVGQTVERGQELWGVDGTPVTLFYGTVPFWRPLHVGVTDGPDILELQQNLSALGYTGFTVDDHFGWSTQHAVEQWQHDLGVEQSGTLQPSTVAVQATAVRVTSVSAALGGPAGGALMAVTGTAKEVTVALPVNQQAGTVTAGAAVTVELPGSAVTTGKIADVGTVAVTPTPAPGAQAAPPTIAVHVSLDHPDDVRALDGAPVTVDFTGRTRQGALVVPIGALLALTEGGFAVEVVEAGGSRHLQAVTPGMFADGRVEVTGSGLVAGQRVTVAGA